ncbi:MAG TPA: PQQ-binding-like beta-propeller repeat protein [Vicinamibacterales bacterium]|nr:PQQ-binding-like beta-propeller repeat protein [Vicinamibacterales bacterium]
MRRSLLVAVGSVVLSAIVAGQQASRNQAPGRGDWPQWRGTNRDGAAAFTVPSTWPEKLNQRWKVEVGIGYAAPITAGDRVYAFSRQNEDEVMRALDAATGKTIWETKYNATYKPNPAATSKHGTGPKSTPTFADGRLYSLGMSGLVTAFDAATGKQLWQTAPPKTETLYHTGMSPIVDRGLVIAHVGGHNDGALTAFDAQTGAVKWAWTGDGPAYGSPIIAELGGTRQVITMTQENLVGVSVADGSLLWKRPYSVRATRNAVTPIVHNLPSPAGSGAASQLVIVSGLGMPVSGFRVINRAGQWSTEDVWVNNDTTMDMSTGVVIGNTLYGFSARNSGQFFALDANTGQTQWLSEPRQAENAAVVRAGDLWFALQTDAQLVVARANPKQFEIVKRYEVANSATWAQPVLSGQRVFIKDLSTISLWTLN